MKEYKWGPASVAYPDWKGTAQLDRKIYGDDDIYSITGVDSEQWTIIGFELGGGASGMHDPHVVAVPAGTDLSLERLEATDFQIHDVDAIGMLLRMIHSFDLRFRLRGVEDTEIVVTDLADVPEQD